jgi:formamidopyrimidine-DNA glycosylase
MPELPEVEVTRLGIEPHLLGRTVQRVVVRQRQLRFPVPATLNRRLPGQTISAVRRRAKYLLIDMPAGTLIIHLGMSGSLRVLTTPTAPQKHDHFDLMCDGVTLRLNDPRRFGAVLWQAAGAAPSSVLKKLGVEPLTAIFTGAYFWQQTRARRVPIKNLLLAGDVVVGVGNIYASESLFRARIHPARAANRISLARYERLAAEIKAVLQAAIAQGGSTLRDFVDSAGEAGYFQQSHQVYGRERLPCVQCGAAIRALRQGQRSTFYCPHCQR